MAKIIPVDVIKGISGKYGECCEKDSAWTEVSEKSLYEVVERFAPHLPLVIARESVESDA